MFFFTQRHAFHLVDSSIMPLLSSFSCLITTLGAVLYFHGFLAGFKIQIFGVFSILVCMVFWWRDVVREGTLEGRHTNIVQLGLRYGMILFIVSEIMFFFAFFWAFFASSLAPAIDIGAIWPPKGIEVFNPWEIPLLNTLILLCSGVTVTWAHHAIVAGSREEAILGLFFTICLGAIFTGFQGFEYAEAAFCISDGVYGSSFFMATGFHGFHVFVGTIFLVVCLVRMLFNHFTVEHHFGFEAAAFYWHFVDIVWLFLYVAIYF